MRILACLIGAATLGLANVALGDTTLVYNAENSPFKVRVRPGAIRIDDQAKRWQLYRQSENTIYSVNPDNDTYVRMDADTAATIRNEMKALRKRMEKKLAELPPEQRDTARAALADQIPGFGKAPAEPSIQSTGEQTRVAGRQCRIVEVQRGESDSERLCVAERKALGMSEKSFATIESMFALMKTMLSGTGLAYVGLPYVEIGGMPIRYTGGSETGQRTLSRVNHDDLSDLVFEIPASYKEQRPQLNE